jgi:hypothetical protein
MKNIGNLLVAAAMVVGSVAAIGCNRSNDSAADQGQEAVAPEESPTSAPVDDTAGTASQNNAPGIEQDYVSVTGLHCYGVPDWSHACYTARVAPPALRVEVPGRAPSDRHFWAPGYWRWTGHEHAWVGGRWTLRRPGYDYVGPRWANVHNRWQYAPGRWIRRS